MDRQQVITLIGSTRKTFQTKFKPESVKGWRFRDNDKVIRCIRMNYYTEKFEPTGNPEQLPSIEQVPDKWIEENINNVLDDLSYADYHFSNKEKWAM